MQVGLALLVSADPVTIHQFSHALKELSISSDVCQEVPAAVGLLNRQKFEAVIVDLQLGEQCGHDLGRGSSLPSNRTAVTFGIGNNDAKVTRLSARSRSLSSKDRFPRSRSTKLSSLHTDSS